MSSASTPGLQRPDLLRGAGLIDGQWVAARSKSVV